jgi:hypothetical protein
MSKYHKQRIESKKVQKDYRLSNHTRNNFKTWLKTATYKEVLQMYQAYKEKIMKYNVIRSKELRIYPLVKSQNKIENLQIMKYKYNLLTNKLNMMVIKNG